MHEMISEWRKAATVTVEEPQRRRWGKAGVRLTEQEAKSRGMADFGGYSVERGCDH